MVLLQAILYALLTAMEQSVLEEFLFLGKRDLILEFVSYLRQEILNSCSKGGNCFLLSLVWSIEVPHQNIIGFNISINNAKILMMVSREASEPILHTVSTAVPFIDL